MATYVIGDIHNTVKNYIYLDFSILIGYNNIKSRFSKSRFECSGGVDYVCRKRSRTGFSPG